MIFLNAALFQKYVDIFRYVVQSIIGLGISKVVKILLPTPTTVTHRFIKFFPIKNEVFLRYFHTIKL